MNRSAPRPHRSSAGAARGGRRTALRRSLPAAVLSTVAGAVFLASAASAVPAGAAEPAAGSAASTAGSPAEAEKSLVFLAVEWSGQVQYPTEDGGWAWSEPVEAMNVCTGWFASADGDIVTAGHCVDPAVGRTHVLETFLAENDATSWREEALAGWEVAGQRAGAPDRGAVSVVQPSAVEGAVIEDWVTVQVVDWMPREDGDLALLKAHQLSAATPPLTVSADEPEVGDPVTAIGYPGNVRSYADFDRLRASFKSGTVSSVLVTRSGVQEVEVNADLSGGMSGGPTVDAAGEVLGVNSSGFEDQAFNFITDGQALGAFLDRNGVEVPTRGDSGDVVDRTEQLPGPSTLPAPPAAADSSLPEWPYLAGGGAGVLALAATGAVLLRRRSASLAATSGPASPVPTPPAPAAYVAAGAPAYAGAAPAADATRQIRREGPVGPAGWRPPVCDHSRSVPGARFCGDCGAGLTA